VLLKRLVKVLLKRGNTRFFIGLAAPLQTILSYTVAAVKLSVLEYAAVQGGPKEHAPSFLPSAVPVISR
jgi:hypothetical protein